MSHPDRIQSSPVARLLCALVLLAATWTAQAQTLPDAQHGGRIPGLEGVYLAVAGLGGAHERPAAGEGAFPVLALSWRGSGMPLAVGAHVSVANQPRMTRSVLFSGILSF